MPGKRNSNGKLKVKGWLAHLHIPQMVWSRILGPSESRPSRILLIRERHPHHHRHIHLRPLQDVHIDSRGYLLDTRMCFQKRLTLYPLPPSNHIFPHVSRCSYGITIRQIQTYMDFGNNICIVLRTTLMRL